VLPKSCKGSLLFAASWVTKAVMALLCISMACARGSEPWGRSKAISSTSSGAKETLGALVAADELLGTGISLTSCAGLDLGKDPIEADNPRGRLKADGLSADVTPRSVSIALVLSESSWSLLVMPGREAVKASRLSASCATVGLLFAAAAV